jgi:hypothetical protein
VSAEPPPRLTWRDHPFARRPRASVLVCAAMALSWWLGWRLLGAAGVVLAAFGTILPLGPYLLPTEYTLGPDGAAERRLWQWRRFRWDELVGYDVYRDAVHLVLDPRSLSNRVQKGLLLPLAGTDRDRLLAVIEHYLPAETPPDAGV